MSSWRTRTQKQYAIYLNKGVAFCREGQINCYSRPLTDIDTLQFLISLYNVGFGYSTLNNARSALSTVIQLQGGESFDTQRICHTIYEGCFRITTT